MSMLNVFQIAGSALNAQSLRLNTNDSNLANADRVSGDPNQVYKAKHPLFEAVRAADRGEYFLLPSITAKVLAEFSRLSRPSPRQNESLAEPLSAREIEILKLVATGASNKEIAETLVIAEGTVKNHLTSIFSKLDVKDRMQAVIKSGDLGII